MVEAIEDIRRSTRRSSLVGGLGKIKEVSIFHFREMPFLFTSVFLSGEVFDWLCFSLRFTRQDSFPTLV